nr:hypothetical protein [Tanacetum cinerariifolium]
MQKNQDLLPKNRLVYAVPRGYAPSLINPNWVLGGCWEVVGKVTGSHGKWWSGAEMGESGVAGCGGNLG